jgi:hypothetical protein
VAQFLTKAIGRYVSVPETITIDGSAANEAAINTAGRLPEARQGTVADCMWFSGCA